jgi:hypothetical protein
VCLSCERVFNDIHLAGDVLRGLGSLTGSESSVKHVRGLLRFSEASCLALYRDFLLHHIILISMFIKNPSLPG